jgi:hypothetical protein
MPRSFAAWFVVRVSDDEAMPPQARKVHPPTLIRLAEYNRVYIHLESMDEREEAALLTVRATAQSILAQVDALLPKPKNDLTGMHRTDAIQRILESQDGDGIMSPMEMVAALHAAGRSDGKAVVYTTMSKLAEIGRIENVNWGRYRRRGS